MPELLAVARGEKYEKLPMEDLIQMGQGIEGEKGKVGVSFGRPLNSILSSVELPTNRNELFSKIASIIDTEIHSTYHLMPSNYKAYDLIKSNNQFKDKYTPEQLAEFEVYIKNRLDKVEGEETLKRTTFLEMYAYPVKNKLETL